MAKRVTFELDTDDGSIFQEGTLFVGETAEVAFTGYTGDVTLVIYQKRPGACFTEVARTSTRRNTTILNLSGEEVRNCFMWNNRNRPFAKVALNAYVTDGDDKILASGVVQVEWSPEEIGGGGEDPGGGGDVYHSDFADVDPDTVSVAELVQILKGEDASGGGAAGDGVYHSDFDDMYPDEASVDQLARTLKGDE